MKTQRSRNSLNELKRYSGVYQQMGRMFTDSDWNELSDMAKNRLSDALADVIGSGTPRERGLMAIVDNGDGTQSHRLKWGYAYVNGIAAQVRPAAGATLVDPAGELFEYQHQADFPAAPPLPVAGNYTYYLDVWERTVITLEDSELRDPGLHGADTCTRTQTMAQVKWCPSGLDPEDNTVNPAIGDAELTLVLREGSTAPDPCDPCADEITLQDKVGNYLFRIEIHQVEYDVGGLPERVVLKWSSENGAEQYEIDSAPPGFESDNFTYEFYSGPSVTETSTSEKQLGRHLATGFIATTGALEAGYPDSPPAGYSLVRRWDGYCELVKVGASWTLVRGSDMDAMLSTEVAAGAHGYVAEGASVGLHLDAMTVTLNLGDHQALSGDYWSTEVRQDRDVAGDELLTEVLPEGILHHYMTLGSVLSGEFVAFESEQCKRFDFPPLTDIQAGDVCYEVKSCDIESDSQATVRQLLEERLGDDFPDPGRTKLATVLDALLCQHSAATLPLLKNDELCPTLQDDSIRSVQDALNTLCILEASGCSTITVHPGPNWQRPIVALPRGVDVSICFRPGEYYLDDTLLIENTGHLKISGAGAGSRIICRGREAALHLSNCASVNVSGLSFEGGAVGDADQNNHLLGALTVSGCEKVAVTNSFFKCAAGTRLGATCLTIRSSRQRSGHATVSDCELNIGHRQNGMLLLNMKHAFVQNNRLSVRPKPASMTLERQMSDARFAASARKLLLNNTVVRGFSRVSTAGKQNLHLPALNNRQIYIDSPVAGTDWRSAIMDSVGQVNVRSNQHLLAVAKSTARRVLVDRAFRARFRSFNEWFEVLRLQNPAYAQVGIVCGGEVASDIQLLNNHIKGVQLGVQVGVSHRNLRRAQRFSAGRVLIDGNNINLIVAPVTERRRGGIFVGNCNNLTVQNNQILTQRFPLSRRVRLEGVRVFGLLGRMLMMNQNYMTHCNIGIRVTPVEIGNDSVQWLIADNMMPNAQLAVAAPRIVRSRNNLA